MAEPPPSFAGTPSVFSLPSVRTRTVWASGVLATRAEISMQHLACGCASVVPDGTPPSALRASSPRGTGKERSSGFRAHVGEQQYVADRGGAGHQHHEAVDADAQATGRRQAHF